MVFDEITFVNLWFELFGGGIVIASVFYALTTMHTDYIHEERHKKIHKQKIQEIINDITSLLERIYNTIKDKKIADAKELLNECNNTLPGLAKSIKGQKEDIYNRISKVLPDVKYNLQHLSADNDTRATENMITNTINTIKNGYK
jgi:ElaB/YqjD/DUF883 family membrane-anchored ribosome-binding protein